jgi:hypothetical protein
MKKTPTTDRTETVYLSTTARRHLVEELERTKTTFWRWYGRLRRAMTALDKARAKMDRLLKRIAKENNHV